MVDLGVEDGSKAHRLYDPQTKKIVISRDVVFEEAVAWKWGSEYSEGSEFVVVEVVEAITQTQGAGGRNDADHGDHQSSGPQPTGDGS